MEPARYDVLCAGILVADLFAPPLPRLPEEGELLLVDRFLLTTGGCAANTGVGLARLGAHVAIVGMVGPDLYGDFVIRDIAGKGCSPDGVRRSPQTATSRTVILPVIGQDRRFIHSFGANADFTVGDIDRDLVSRSRCLYVGGYLAMPKLDPAEMADLFRFARERKVVTVLDVVVSMEGEGWAKWGDWFTDLLPYTDVFLPNDDEARELCGLEEPEDQAAFFLEKGADTVIITQGENGAYLARPDQSLRVPAFPMDVMDPSGAGDGFDAGLIFGLISGWNWEESLRLGAAVGASATRRLGCTDGLFTLAEAEAFLAAHPARSNSE